MLEVPPVLVYLGEGGGVLRGVDPVDQAPSRMPGMDLGGAENSV